MLSDRPFQANWGVRFLRFSLWLVAVGLVMAIAILILTGYRFNFRKATLEPVGLLQISTTPSGSTITVNQSKLNWWTGYRVNATTGNYPIHIVKDGYLPWEKVIPIEAGQVHWVNARLIPKTKRIELVKPYSQLIASHASPNRRFLLNQLDKNHYELADLKPSTPTYTDLKLGDLVSDAASRDLVFYDWLTESNQLLFRDRAGGQNGDLFLVNFKDQRQAVNLSARYLGSDLQFDDFRIADADNQVAFVRSGQKLWRINLAKPDQITQLLDHVLAMRVIDNELLSVVEAAPEGLSHQAVLKIYNYTKNQSVVIDQIPAGQPLLVEAFHFDDGKQYLAYVIGQQLRVVSGDFNYLNSSPAASHADLLGSDGGDSLIWQRFTKANSDIKITKQKLTTTPRRLFASRSGRLIMLDLGDELLPLADYQKLANNLRLLADAKLAPASLWPELPNVDGQPTVSVGQKWLVYDVDYKKSFVTIAEANSGSRALNQAVAPKMIDDRIIWENLAGTIRIKDFDGQNQHKLIPAPKHLDIQLTPNESFVYYFGPTANNQIGLYRLMMTGF